MCFIKKKKKEFNFYVYQDLKIRGLRFGLDIGDEGKIRGEIVKEVYVLLIWVNEVDKFILDY